MLLKDYKLWIKKVNSFYLPKFINNEDLEEQFNNLKTKFISTIRDKIESLNTSSALLRSFKIR